MTNIEIALWCTLIVTCYFANVGMNAAYRNGVTDGYGYAREPRNPGYKTAGDFLRKHMNHRWRELRIQSPRDNDPDLIPFPKDSP
jgi:hypothetical protein